MNYGTESKRRWVMAEVWMLVLGLMMVVLGLLLVSRRGE